MIRVPAPRTEAELLAWAAALDGLSLGLLAARLGYSLVQDPRRGKGQVGELVEQALGATAKNLDLPDFPELGIELKTIPLDAQGHVRESTFVCALDLAAVEDEEWASSRVQRKLACVLWVPIEASGSAPLVERRFGTPRLWRPTPEQETRLRADWFELVGRIAVGGIEEISGYWGEVLQIRPKASHGTVKVLARGPEGELIPTIPRGFYLRARFTEEILWCLARQDSDQGLP